MSKCNLISEDNIMWVVAKYKMVLVPIATILSATF